ncbi:MAG: hypothetical protein OXC69_10820 [Candidatus Tectomicrobia bacterium]|nr:hypothetical protein [Candidatus Tectomicrobia bacterium]
MQTTGGKAAPNPVVLFMGNSVRRCARLRAGKPQGDLMRQRVKEDGESECRTVTVRIPGWNMPGGGSRAHFHLVAHREIVVQAP